MVRDYVKTISQIKETGSGSWRQQMSIKSCLIDWVRTQAVVDLFRVLSLHYDVITVLYMNRLPTDWSIDKSDIDSDGNHNTAVPIELLYSDYKCSAIWQYWHV